MFEIVQNTSFLMIIEEIFLVFQVQLQKQSYHFTKFGPCVNEANHVGVTMINIKMRLLNIHVYTGLLPEHVGKAKKKLNKPTESLKSDETTSNWK